MLVIKNTKVPTVEEKKYHEIAVLSLGKTAMTLPLTKRIILPYGKVSRLVCG
jgi:hypothetical protein